MGSWQELRTAGFTAALAGLLSASGTAQAAEPVGLKLTPRLKALITEEMQLISAASGQVWQAMVAGDHATVADQARQIHESFIMKQSLTDQDKADLKAAVPPEFIALDGEFHGTAARLAEAAQAGDVTQQLDLFAQMTQTCVTCHAEYASAGSRHWRRSEGSDAVFSTP